MIVYDKFWETMKRCGESTYTLINHYNISSGTIDRIRKGQGITTAKLDDFCQIFHCWVEDLITYVEDRKGHDRRYAIAPDKIKAEIGWEPETMFKDGIRKTIAWFFENEEWMKNVTSGDYQKYYENMYNL